MTPVAHKVSKKRVEAYAHLNARIRNPRSSVKIWGVCTDFGPKHDTVLSFVVVEKELKSEYKGRWGQCTWEQFKEGYLDTI